MRTADVDAELTSLACLGNVLRLVAHEFAGISQFKLSQKVVNTELRDASCLCEVQRVEQGGSRRRLEREAVLTVHTRLVVLPRLEAARVVTHHLIDS